MAAEKSYARLGLFVVVGLAVMIATGLFFIERLKARAVIELVTYFNENVSGLDISSPVRYRGVSVGRVSDIRIDPRGNIVEVDFELFQDRLANIGANVGRLQEAAQQRLTNNLRARVVGNPVTGEGYLLLDLPTDAPPPMNLGFTPTRPYVPSMPSPLAEITDRLPALFEQAQQTFATLQTIVARVPDSLDRSDRFFSSVERIIRDSHLPELTADSRTFFATTSGQIAQTSAQIAQLTSAMDRLVGAEGTLTKFADEARTTLRESNVPAASQAARDAAERTSLAADDLRRMLPTIRETLEQLRELARQLEQQPESVIYGVRKGKGKS